MCEKCKNVNYMIVIQGLVNNSIFYTQFFPGTSSGTFSQNGKLDHNGKFDQNVS